MKRIHLVISGDVQGIGFRAWARRHAQELGLMGWVRNNAQGTVEAVVEGKRSDLEEFVKRCQRGPEVAWVEKVDVKWTDATGTFLFFEIQV